MDILQQLLPNSILYALGLTLLHFIWQAVIIALVLGFMLVILRKSSPLSRYIASISAFALLPLTTLFTFVSQYLAFQQMVYQGSDFVIANITENGMAYSFLQKFLALYVDYLPFIVLVWMLGVSAMLLKSVGNLIVIQRLKHHYVQEAGERIKSMVDAIGEKLSVRKKIRVLNSLKVDSPMIIGHLKPVLLLPEKSMEHLNNAELNAVLHHEIAHIKRHDYLVNLIQTIIEILFFFHPATWWISGIIRKEREECCDVYAIHRDEDKVSLANALAKLTESQLTNNSLAMSVLGTKNNLLKRIKNMFTNRPILPSFKEGIIVALFFVATVFRMCFITISGDGHEPERENSLLVSVSGETNNGRYVFAKTDEHGQIVKLFVEGKRIKAKKFKDYQQVIDSLIASNERKAESLKRHQANAQKLGANKAELLDKSRALQQKAEELREKSNAIENETVIDGSHSPLFNEVMKEVSRELEKEFGEDFNFNMNVDDTASKFNLQFDEKGLYMDVDDKQEQVKMTFDENGFYLNVIENGKESVHINFSAGSKEKKKDE